MPPPSGKTFPSFKSFARLNSLHKATESTEFFDCKFYPYTDPGVDPVFAVVGRAEAIVCRPAVDDKSGVEVLAWFHDDDPKASLNSCTWSQDLTSGDPLLCVGGQSATVRVFNVRTEELVTTFVGHGKDINDLAISPLSPQILASASMDYTVRFWSLDPLHKKQPCMLICGGEGHKEGLLTMSFHQNGKYLLTGGMDCLINLWVIPELPNEASGTDKPTIIHNPHFSTSAVHISVVDCVQWCHDLIMSKSAEDCKIVLWRIEGFDSTKDPPSRAPTTHEFRATRSAFGGTYQRLLEFDAAECTPFYMRFSLFMFPQRRPILAIGNEKSRVFFWDLQALEEWDGTEIDISADSGTQRQSSSRGRGGRKRGQAGRLQQREDSIYSSATSATPDRASTAMAEEEIASKGVLSKASGKYSVDGLFQPVLPHNVCTVPRVAFTARQLAWSIGGEWAVVVGGQGMVALFYRQDSQ